MDSAIFIRACVRVFIILYVDLHTSQLFVVYWNVEMLEKKGCFKIASDVKPTGNPLWLKLGFHFAIVSKGVNVSVQ